MNTNSTSEMTELLTAHCIEFNDRVIVVEESERGVSWEQLEEDLRQIMTTLGINGFITHLFQMDLEVHIRRSSLKGLIVNIESTLMS